MRTFAAVAVTIAVLVVAGYIGLPILIQKENRGLRSDLRDVQQRLDNIEEQLRKEEEAKKAGQLPSDAGAQSIIKAVNTVSAKVSALEESSKKELAAVAEGLKQQKISNEAALKKQSEHLEKTFGEIRSDVRRTGVNIAMATVRGNLIKVQMELKSKNVGTAKTEIDLVNDLLEKTKTATPDDQKKAIEEFQAALKKANDEMNSNLPAAIDRVDLLWHEMGKLIRQ